MRYSQAHAAKSGSVPFALRGPKSVRTALAAAIAAAVGLVPAFLGNSPAMADGGVLTVSDASATEGADLVFTVKWTGTADTFTIAAVPGTATTSDYTPPPTTLAFTGPGTKTVTVKTTDDSLYELTETFELTATSGPDTSSGLGTIYDNDPKPSVTLNASPATVSEGDPNKPNGTTKVTATLSTRSGVDTVIPLTTADVSAVAGADYSALTGDSDATLTIPAGKLTAESPANIPITIYNDGIKDKLNTETFTVTGNSNQTEPAQASTTVSIVDAQTTPVLTLTQDGNGTIKENDGSITYTVTATPGSELPITVKWDAVAVTPKSGDDAAAPGVDFPYPTSRTLTLTPNHDGVPTASFSIAPPNDSLSENSEDYGIQLSSPTNATLDPKASMVTSIITDFDHSPMPVVSVLPSSVTEGNSGKQTRTFTASLSTKAGRVVTVNWATDDDLTDGAVKATAGKDYVKKSGTLVFPAGVLTQTFTVDIVGDTVSEGDETFAIDLSSPDSTAVMPVPAAVPITITDDDAAPTVTFDGPTMKEGDSANAILLPIKLSNPSSKPIVFDIADTTASKGGSADGNLPTAPGTSDYTLLATTVTIQPGQTSGVVPVLVNGDKIFEGDEDAFFTATAEDSTLVSTQSPTATARLMLLNDDTAPVLTIDNVTGNEGDTVAVTGTVSGQADADVNVNVSFAGGSVKGSKAATDSDFVNPGVTPVTIPVGTPDGGTISVGNVTLTDDTTAEPDETIVVSGTPAASVVPGAITIAASDGGSNTPPVTPTFNVPKSVSGAVAVPISGKAAAGATVELWGAPMGATKTPLVKIASTTADKNGVFSFSRWIGQGYLFQIAVGDWTSDTKTVTVTEVPVFVAGSTSKGVVSLAVQGNPRGPGQSVVVQRYVNGAWVKAWGGTTDSSNQWKASPKVASHTVLTLRAFVAGNTATGISAGYSTAKKITVK